MKVAYLTSCYPAVSHTFILREVAALRERGVQVITFSVRRPGSGELTDEAARGEAAATRWLVPPPLAAYAGAILWALLTRPLLTLRTLAAALWHRDMMLRQRVLWLCYLGEAILLAYWLTRGGVDRIHCHFGNNGAATGMLAAMLAKVPFSMTCHGSELLDPARHRLADKVARASFVACVSRYGRAQLMLTCPPEQWDRLHIVRCGVAATHGRTAGPHNAVPQILCVGRLSREKGHLILLDALARLRDRGCVARLTLIGDGPMRAMIEDRIRTLKLGDLVTLTGSLAPEAVAVYYRQTDVLALASFSEGVPVVLMEAMAHGLPVVASRVGGIPELVEHDVSGLLVAPGDADELADALKRVITEPDLAIRLGQAGVRAVEREFLLGPAVERLIALFRQSDAVTKGVASRADLTLPAPAKTCLETS